MSKPNIPLTYLECNSLNGIASMLNHMGMTGQAMVLLSIQRKIAETIGTLEDNGTAQVVANGEEE